MMIANRYEPTGNVAAGGMGEIIECTDTHLRRRVIIKRLQTGIEQRRLVDEQKALAKLRSKHVVQLFDIVELTDRGFLERAIVLEFIDGDNLDVGKLNSDLLYVKILWQLACGLRDIHGANIIHRDIKPSNIRLDKEGVIKIIDFGLARTAGLEAKTRSIIGTPVFMAPELWGTATVSFSKSIDTYAFGVTALALLSSSVPTGLAKEPPQPIGRTTLNPIIGALAADVGDIIFNCLNPNPSMRPDMEVVQGCLLGICCVISIAHW